MISPDSPWPKITISVGDMGMGQNLLVLDGFGMFWSWHPGFFAQIFEDFAPRTSSL